MSVNSNKASTKRKQYSKVSSKNPKRGGPGVLLTCETGRERKCRIEGLEIIQHYVKDPASVAAKEDKKLSLEDEIKQLQQDGKDKQKHVVSPYETDVRGTVTLLCTKREWAMISPYVKENSTGNDDDDAEEKPAKKRKVEEELADTSIVGVADAKPWDPVKTVCQIIKDLKSGSSDAPTSRFVTRMVPLQATCFASEEEMTHTVQQLLATLPKSADGVTFAIKVKRRICAHWKRDGIIDFMAKLVPKDWKVNLTKPTYTIVVELMKTLCGISIVEAMHEYGNFNLMEAREGKAEKELLQEGDAKS